jgi:hypothetical protein
MLGVGGGLDVNRRPKLTPYRRAILALTQF